MSYTINIDYAKHRVEVTMYAYQNDTKKFFAEFQHAAIQAKGGGKSFDCAVDFTQMSGVSPVMPQNISHESNVISEWSIAHGMRRSANILNSVLFKMQLHRNVTGDHFATFSNRADAEAWLDEA